MIDESFAKYHLKRERAFLFLSIIIASALLSSFPESLKLFITGTSASITGGVVAVEAVGMKDYVTGLVIFVFLGIFLGYLVHVLRNPAPESWLPQVAEEDEFEFTSSLDKNKGLEHNLDQVNVQIKKLRTVKEMLKTPKTRARKITKVPDANEVRLDYELRRITAQLHGYQNSPVVLPIPTGKGQWDDDLELVKKELATVDQMKIKEAKVREEIPSEREISLQHENKKLQEELKQVLSKKKNISKPVMVFEEPLQKQKWNEDLEKVNTKLGNVDQMEIKAVKIREKVPHVHRIIETIEQKQLARELQRLHQTLEEEEKNASYSVKRFIPATREWQLASIKRQIGKKGAVRNKEELAAIEEKLSKIYAQ